MSDAGKAIDPDQIAAILAMGRSSGIKADPTEDRTVTTWFKLNHTRVETECDNPTCTDPRPEGDRGRKIVAQVKGQNICRYCFLQGWLKKIDV